MINAPKIRLLDKALIDQIAAGEVIESPASIVKELMDNAVDAGADQIAVEFRAGGRQSIRVSDNGCGMSPEDCQLCFERHATSKIQRYGDLSQLVTSGFRGEALAAIAAVSKLSLVSCDGSACHRIEVEGGCLVHSTRGARQRGTSLEVTSLFYNTPARREYQGSLARDVADIVAVFTQMALAYPDVGMRLVKNGGELFCLNPCNGGQEEFLHRIEQMLGRAFAENLVWFSWGRQVPLLQGFLATPGFDRPNRAGQYLAVNKRPVSSPGVSAAVAQGYGARLSPRRFPCYVLHLQCAPHEVDFNVHPQKKEVRLKGAGKLMHWISSGVDRHFLKKITGAAPAAGEPLPWERAPDLEFPSAHFSGEVQQIKFGDLQLKANTGESIDEGQSWSEGKVPIGGRPDLEDPLSMSAPALFPEVLDEQLWRELLVAVWPPYLLVNPAPLISQAPRTWWQMGPKGSWLILDFPKASAWLHAQQARADRPVAQQLLMQPLQVSLSAEHAELLSDTLGELEVWGLSLARAGLREFVCTAAPQTLVCTPSSLAECLREFAELTSSWARARYLARWFAEQSWQCRQIISSGVARQLVQRVLQAEVPPRAATGEAVAAVLLQEDFSKILKSRG